MVSSLLIQSFHYFLKGTDRNFGNVPMSIICEKIMYPQDMLCSLVFMAKKKKKSLDLIP